MKKLFFLISLLVILSSQAQINRVSFFKMGDGDMWGEKFINTQTNYFKKYVQEAKDKNKVLNWNVWRLRGPSYSDHTFAVSTSYETIQQSNEEWGLNVKDVLDVEGKYLWDDDWNWIENQIFRVQTSVPGNSKFVVVTYINHMVWERVNNQADYWEPVMQKMISNGDFGLKSYSSQTLIYPSKTKDGMKMFVSFGFDNYSDALSFVEPGYVKGEEKWNIFEAAIKKVHGDKKPEYDTGFGLGEDSYSLIYEKITSTN